jgi:hypothetical protein
VQLAPPPWPRLVLLLPPPLPPLVLLMTQQRRPLRPPLQHLQRRQPVLLHSGAHPLPELQQWACLCSAQRPLARPPGDMVP